MDLHRGTKHKTLATRASHTLYFDTILLTNGALRQGAPLLSPRHHSCDRSRFPLGGHLIMKAMVKENPLLFPPKEGYTATRISILSPRPPSSNYSSSKHPQNTSTKYQRKCKHPQKNLRPPTPIPLSTYQVFISPHVNPKDYVRRSKDYAPGSNFTSTGR